MSVPSSELSELSRAPTLPHIQPPAPPSSSSTINVLLYHVSSQAVMYAHENVGHCVCWDFKKCVKLLLYARVCVRSFMLYKFVKKNKLLLVEF